jgi:hypothetical protein
MALGSVLMGASPAPQSPNTDEPANPKNVTRRDAQQKEHLEGESSNIQVY